MMGTRRTARAPAKRSAPSPGLPQDKLPPLAKATIMETPLRSRRPQLPVASTAANSKRQETTTTRLEQNTYIMPSAAGTDTAALVVEIKRLDPGVVNRAGDYPGLAKGTNVLVTTGGAVSTATVSQLQSAGCKVTVVGTTGVATTPSAAALDCVVADGSAMSPENCAKAVASQDVVIHAGRPTSDACHTALAQGTRNLLEAAAAAGVKAFVYASSARCCLFLGVGDGVGVGVDGVGVDVVGIGPVAGGYCVLSKLCCRPGIIVCVCGMARQVSGSQ